MSTRKSYMSLLKEAIGEFDTSKTVDVKGPFLDPILGYDGGGELPTHKDASSILERYYFNENKDPGVSVTSEEAEIPQVGSDKGALDDEPETVDQSKKDIAAAVKETPVKEQDEKKEEEEEKKEEEEEKEEEESEGEPTTESELDSIENAVIQKLIAEMEEVDDFTEDDAGTIVAGTDERDDRALTPDFKAGEVPDRKDQAEKLEMEAFDAIFSEQDEADEDETVPGGEETPKEETEELDVDEKVEEAVGPDLRSSAHDPEDMGDRQLEEQFLIFKEAIEDGDDPEEDDEKDEDEETPTSKKISAEDIRI